MARVRSRAGPALAGAILAVLLLFELAPASAPGVFAPPALPTGDHPVPSESPPELSARGSPSARVAGANPSIPVGVDPDAITFDGQNGFLYVANSRSNNVTVLDGSSDRAVGSVSVGTAPESISFDPAEGELFVANSASSNVSVLNGASDQVVASIPVGKLPDASAYDATDGDVYVANYFSDFLTVIDPATDRGVGSIPVALEMDAMAYDSANQRIYVASWGLPDLFVIDGATGEVVGEIGVGINPAAIEFDAANGLLYVVNRGSDNLTVVDGATDQTVASIPVGLLPGADAANGASGYVYVANSGSNNLSAIDGATDQVVGTLPVGSEPEGVAYDASNGLVYVADSNSDNVTVIDPSILPCPPCYAVSFHESGLIPGGRWSVLLDGANRSSTTDVVLFTEPDGSYTFTLGVVAGFDVSSDRGSLIVQGANVTERFVFSSTTPGIVGYIPVGPFPDAIAFDSGNHHLLVSTLNFSVEGGGNVAEIDDRTNTVVGPAAPVRNGSQTTAALAFDPANGDVYVAEGAADEIEVINGSSDQTIGSVRVGAEPTGAAYDPVNQAVYVTNLNSGNVSVLNGTTNTVEGSVPVLPSPSDIAVDSSNGDVFVGDGPDDFSVISPRTNSVIATVEVGARADAMAFDSLNGDVYVVTSPAGSNSSDLTVIDASTYRIVTKIALPTPESLLPDISLDASTGYLYVTTVNETRPAGNLTMIDGASNTIVGSIPLGNGSNPAGLAFDNRNGDLYVTDWAAEGYVVVINASLFTTHGSALPTFPGLSGYAILGGCTSGALAYAAAFYYPRRKASA